MLVIDRDAGLQRVITRGDVLRALDNHPSGAIAVLDAGTRSVMVTYPDEVWHEAAVKMLRNDIGRLPVVDRSD
jgi:chloride channel protein, CIC family